MTNHFVGLSIYSTNPVAYLTSKSDGLHSDHRSGSHGDQFQFPISLQRLIVQARPPWPAGTNSIGQHEVMFGATLFKMWVVTIQLMNWWFTPTAPIQSETPNSTSHIPRAIFFGASMMYTVLCTFSVQCENDETEEILDADRMKYLHTVC
jgi:hypothetical protein